MQVMANLRGSGGGLSLLLVDHGDEQPDEARGQHHRFRFAQVEKFLQYDHPIGHDEYRQGRGTHPVAGEIEQPAAAFFRQDGLRGEQEGKQAGDVAGHGLRSLGRGKLVGRAAVQLQAAPLNQA